MMTFANFIDTNYGAAFSEAQEWALLDNPMIDAIGTYKNIAPEQVQRWMYEYSIQRNGNVSNEFVSFVKEHKNDGLLKVRLNAEPFLIDADIRKIFEKLFRIFYRIKQRSWLSATSKLLWCIYPYDIVMYDKFSYNAIAALQSLEPCLNGITVGSPPTSKKDKEKKEVINSDDAINETIAHYMNYQTMVKILHASHKTKLEESREVYKIRNPTAEPYPYDIRVMDKLLWLLGNPSEPKSKQRI